MSLGEQIKQAATQVQQKSESLQSLLSKSTSTLHTIHSLLDDLCWRIHGENGSPDTQEPKLEAQSKSGNRFVEGNKEISLELTRVESRLKTLVEYFDEIYGI